jgi:hypothetical protein
MEDNTLAISDPFHLDHSKTRHNDYDGLIIISYAVLAVVFLVGLYAASIAAGTAAADFTSMSVFP